MLLEVLDVVEVLDDVLVDVLVAAVVAVSALLVLVVLLLLLLSPPDPPPQADIMNIRHAMSSRFERAEYCI